MIAVEFRLKLSSAYSIRVPYSYQCARTYPLPAPSTIKGLCANALWRVNGDNPVKIIKEIHAASLGATSRSEYSIAVSSCTVRVIPMNALLRQFAFTPYIDCMIVFRDDAKDLMNKIKEALQCAPVYLGDSESLVCVISGGINSDVQIDDVNEGDTVSINSLFRFDFMKNKSANEKGVVLYMQDDPCADDAILERYIAPLIQQGDSYSPIDSFSFISSKQGFIIKGKRLKGIFCEDKREESAKQKTKHTRKKKL